MSLTCTVIGGGVDYGSGPYSVIIPAGKVDVSFNITIIDDNIFEEEEKFNLTINTSALPNNVAIGDLDRTTVTIVDNDGTHVNIQYIVGLAEYC